MTLPSDDGETFRCGAETARTGEPCQQPVPDSDLRCHQHPKVELPSDLPDPEPPEPEPLVVVGGLDV